MVNCSRSTRCCNCGQIHQAIPGRHYSSCILLGTRTHGSGSDERLAAERLHSGAFTTFPIPEYEDDQDFLFSKVWTWFMDIKDENDKDRIHLTRRRDSCKGTLKSQAPMVWLRWCSPDGRRGQTRNEKNYSLLWRNMINVQAGDDNDEQLVAWLTLSPLNIGDSRSTRTETAVQCRPYCENESRINNTAQY